VNEALLITGGLVLAVTLTFLLSGMEAGVPRLSRVRVRHLCRQQRTSARILQGFLDRPEEFLWTILVGNTLATFALLSASLYLLHDRLGGHRWLLFSLLTLVAFLLYVVADLLPKMLFQKFPNRLCLALARPFRLIHLALRPVVAPVAWFANTMLRLTGGRRFQDRLFGSREELRSLMQESATALTTEEATMVNRVLDLQNRTVGSLMLPFARVAAVPEDLPVGEFLRLCRESGRERLPVRGAGATRMVGVMALRSALYREDLDPARPVRDYMGAPFHLEPSLRLEEALKRFQRSGHRLAIVLDPDGREVGLVTLGDILRFLFGEMHL
jgi:CBS domain containing-hemolysin-like protein